MSQHRFKAKTSDGTDVVVTLGWDRPLRGHFALVEKVETAHPTPEVAPACEGPGAAADEDDGEDDGFLYSNLSDPNLFDRLGMSPELSYFEGVLSEMGIRAPEQVLRAVEDDAIHNVGNKLVEYDAAGCVMVPEAA